VFLCVCVSLSVLLWRYWLEWATVGLKALDITCTNALKKVPASNAAVFQRDDCRSGAANGLSGHLGLAAASCLAICVTTYLPASNLFFTVGFVIAERIMLLPSLGVLGASVVAATAWRAKATLSDKGPCQSGAVTWKHSWRLLPPLAAAACTVMMRSSMFYHRAIGDPVNKRQRWVWECPGSRKAWVNAAAQPDMGGVYPPPTCRASSGSLLPRLEHEAASVMPDGCRNVSQSEWLGSLGPHAACQSPPQTVVDRVSRDAIPMCMTFHSHDLWMTLCAYRGYVS